MEQSPAAGQYYDIEGTSWPNPPILNGPHSTWRIAGRRDDVYRDGAYIRLVAWRTRHGTYWLSNTLTRYLSNRTMLAIAGSITRILAG